jgi:hypothetical protein
VAKDIQDIRDRTFEFAVRIIKLCQHLDKKAGVPRILSNQLLKAGTSVGANVEEAQGGQSRADFVSKNANRFEGSPRNAFLAETSNCSADIA